MHRRIVAAVAAVALAAGAPVLWGATRSEGAAPAPRYRPGDAAGHIAWVSESIRQMESIRTGMTREQLLRVFATEGGLSTAEQRTYVYRGCPYFKVDVRFRILGRPARDKEGRLTSREGPRDVITSISRPYLAWQIGD